MILPQADTTWFANQLLWTFMFFGLHVLLSYKLFIPDIIRRKRLKTNEIREVDHKIQQANDTMNELNAEIANLRDYEASEKESILCELRDEANQRWVKALIDNQKAIGEYKILVNQETDRYIHDIDEFSKNTKDITSAILRKLGDPNA